MKPLKLTLGQKLAQCRNDARLTQPQVATEVGAKEFQTVSKWERGVNTPELGTLEKLAKLYGKPLSFFLDENTDAPSKVVLEVAAAFELIGRLSHVPPNVLEALTEYRGPWDAILRRLGSEAAAQEKKTKSK